MCTQKCFLWLGASGLENVSGGDYNRHTLPLRRECLRSGRAHAGRLQALRLPDPRSHVRFPAVRPRQAPRREPQRRGGLRRVGGRQTFAYGAGAHREAKSSGKMPLREEREAVPRVDLNDYLLARIFVTY